MFVAQSQLSYEKRPDEQLNLVQVKSWTKMQHHSPPVQCTNECLSLLSTVQKSHTIKNKLLDVKKAISKQEMDRHRGGDSRGMGNGYGGGYGGGLNSFFG